MQGIGKTLTAKAMINTAAMAPPTTAPVFFLPPIAASAAEVADTSESLAVVFAPEALWPGLVVGSALLGDPDEVGVVVVVIGVVKVGSGTDARAVAMAFEAMVVGATLDSCGDDAGGVGTTVLSSCPAATFVTTGVDATAMELNTSVTSAPAVPGPSVAAASGLPAATSVTGSGFWSAGRVSRVPASCARVVVASASKSVARPRRMVSSRVKPGFHRNNALGGAM